MSTQIKNPIITVKITDIFEAYIKKHIEEILKNQVIICQQNIENEIMKLMPTIAVQIGKIMRVDAEGEQLVITLKNDVNLTGGNVI